jgi:predicted negative regulator of RcsB-dependent stress response
LDTLAGLESRGERIIEWIGENARIVLGVSAVLLIAAGIVGYSSGRSDRREDAASAAYEAARSGYLKAMGASPGALIAPELANPEAAASIREEYGAKFAAVAEAHPGTTNGALASLEQGDLIAAGGDDARAREIWQAAVSRLPADEPVAGLIDQRIGRSLEDSGDWISAAESHAAAAAIADYPFRFWAMADAARCYAAANEIAKALDLFARIEAEAPALQLPEDLRVRLKELRAANPG